MLRRFWKWLERRGLEQRMAHAGAVYALSIASGDYRRAERLKAIIDDLHRQRRELAERP